MLIDATQPEFNWRTAYKLLISAVTPRPIALVSTMAADGRLNLAPFSFFNMVSGNPPVLMFAPGLNRRREHKHTYRNVDATREFVVAGVNERIGPQMVRSAADLPYGESEFAFAGLSPSPASLVKPPLVREAPFNLECRLRQIVSLGDGPGSGHVIFGDIVAVHIDDAYLSPAGDALDARRLRMVGRLGGTQYSTVGEPWSMEIPPAPEA